MNESDFQALLRRAVEVAGQKQAAAQAIGISPSRFSKILHAKPGSYTLNARNCFRLAALLGETPQRVLRVVGKGDLADAIEEFYGGKIATDKPPRPEARRLPDPLVAGLAEAVEHWGTDRQLLADWVNLMRKQVGLPPVSQRRGPGRAKTG